MSRSRSWCFTLNNYSVPEVDKLRSLSNVRYCICGFEIGESGTPHIQGFAYFHNAVGMKTVKSLIGDRCHVEIARGNVEQNIAYCSKENDFFEIGDRPEQGHRSDIDEIKKLALEGASLVEIYSHARSYQAMRMAEIGMRLRPPVMRDPPEVRWYWGPTGTGKTRQAWEECGVEDTWVTSTELKWFDGYYGQKNVIIDDFRDSLCKLTDILRITDRYPLKLPVKGGFVNWEPKLIIVTSSHDPRSMYHNVGEDIQQLIRRISASKYFGKVDTEVEGNTNLDTSK